MAGLINIQQDKREAVLTDNTNSDSRLDVQIAAVVPQQFHQAVRTHTRTTVEQLCGGLRDWHVAALLFTAGHQRYKNCFCGIFTSDTYNTAT